MSNSLNSFSDFAVLIMRLSIGIIYMLVFGLRKLTGGVELWKKLGTAMSKFGINFMPEVWGFMAMFSEFFVPILMILGFLYRPSLCLITFTMVMASITHLSKMDPWGDVAFPLIMMFVFISMLIMGPGKFSIDFYLKKKKKTNEA